MKFTITAVFNRSVTLELENEAIFRNPEEVRVLLDGTEVLRTDRNVISLFHLEPDQEYEVTVEAQGSSETVLFHTLKESACLNVKTFGAVGDGVHEVTGALQAAISCCPAQGTVYVPKGTYLTRPLFLKSDLTLYLEQGAVLLGVADRNAYPILPGMIRTEEGEVNFGTWEGNPLDSFASLITMMNCHNVNLIGEGALNGNADQSDWWAYPTRKIGAWRPNTLFIAYSENINVQGITVENSPSWTVHPYYSDHLSFLNLTIQNPYHSPNTDGFDPESCSDVLLLGTVISVGDDCVAIKSGKYYMGVCHTQPSSHITIRNCRLERGHGSVTVGSEVSGGVNHVDIRQCEFVDTDRGLRIKTRRGRGKNSVIDEISLVNVSMDRVAMPVTVNMFYFCDPDGHSDYVQDQNPRPVDELTPTIGSITLEHVSIHNADAVIACIYGLPEQPIRQVRIHDLTADFLPAEKRQQREVLMMDHLEPISGIPFWIKNLEQLELSDSTVSGGAGEPVIEAERTEIRNVIYKR